MASLLAIILLARTSSQTTQCVWDAIDEWSHLNGEFVQEGTFDNGHDVHAYWKRLSPSCVWKEQYIYAAYDGINNLSHWFINHELTTNESHSTPNCGLDSDTFPSDPSQCANGWILSQLTVTHSVCPTLPCDAIQVTDSGDSACDQLFTRDYTKDNVYEYSNESTNTYLYFNPFTFKWHCSYSLSDGCSFNASLLSSKMPQWIQTSSGSSITFEMSNNAMASFDCIAQIYDSTIVPDATTTTDDAKSTKSTPSDQVLIVTLPRTEGDIDTTLSGEKDDGEKNMLSDKVFTLSIGGVAFLCFCVLTSVKYWLKVRRKDKKTESEEEESPNKPHENQQVYIHTSGGENDIIKSNHMTPGQGPALPDSDPLHLTVVSKYEKGALGAVRYEKGKIAKIHPKQERVKKAERGAIRIPSYSTNNTSYSADTNNIEAIKLEEDDQESVGSLPEFIAIDKSYKVSGSSLADMTTSSVRTEVFEQHVLQDMEALNELYPASLSTVAPSIFSDYKPGMLEYARSQEVALETCNDCGVTKLGQIYEGDGEFYCDQCWKNYYGDKKVVTVEGHHNKLAPHKRKAIV